MAQENWWEDDEVIDGPAAPAGPAFPGVIPGRPKVAPPPTAIQIEDQEMDRERLRLAQAAAARAEETAARGSVEQGKAASFAKRAVNAEQTYSQLGVGPRSYIGSKVAALAPDFTSSFLDDSERRRAEQAEREFIAAILRYDSGAAIPPEEFVTNGQIYFPRPGDGPEEIKQKAESRRVAIEGLVGAAGPAGAGLEVPLQVRVTDDSPANHWPGVIGEDGKPLPPEGGYGRDPETGEWGLYGRTTDDSPAPPTEAEAIASDPRFARDDKAVLLNHGFTMGLSDEAAGIGGAIGNLLQLKNPVKGYKLYNEAEDIQVARARKNLGWGGTALEVGSGFGGVRTVAGALKGLTTWQGAKQGGGVGALGGWGYGEGLEGSVINAGAGTVLGGALGGGGTLLGNKLSSRAALANEERAVVTGRATALDEAGRAERVTVNRAMVDPSTANRVTGVDATLSGGPRVQREMRAIEGQIEERVGALGQGGRPMNEVSGGQTVERAGKRAIQQTGKSARRKYDRAERLAGGARVEPRESLSRVNSMIDDLSETASTNADEIAYLQTVRNDLTQDLSVGALRRMRTKLRKKISKGDLVFGEDEARVLAIMDGAADDIRAGLTAQGKGEAAQAFDAADKSYRARMEYISGTVQGLLGKRNANIPAERMWQRFQGMASAKGDSVGLRKFYATLTPEERLDVSATFADELGKNKAGEFSVASFISQAENLSDDAIRTIFGAEGAQSIRNLRVLGKEVKRVTGAMNSRASKTAPANNYREWLMNGLLGATAAGGGGLAGGSTAAAVGAATAVGANALRNALSARLLMSTNITKWIRAAPKTADPAAIDRHFARLGDIAKAEPALAGDIEMLRTAIHRYANDNSAVTASVAQDQGAKEDERQPR